MTVSSTTSRKTFAGNGATTSFSTSPMIFFDTSDLVVYVTLDSDGTSETLVENTDYTATGGDGSTGTLNLAAGSSPYGAPASGYTLVIQRNVPATQAVDLVNNDGSDADVMETALDKLTVLVQQFDGSLDRVARLSDTDVSGADVTLPTPAASKLLGWNASANALANYATSSITASIVPTAYMETLLDDSTAAAARTTLAAAGSGLATASGLTQSTARILGRTTASTGAIEEISVGADMSLASTTLRQAAGYRNGWVQIGAAVTAAAHAAVDFTLTAGYSAYALVLTNVVPGTDNVEPWIRFSDDSGSTFEADASDYRWSSVGSMSSTAETSAADTEYPLGGTFTAGSAAGERFSGVLHIYSPADAAAFTHCDFRGSAVGADGNVRVLVSAGAMAVASSDEAVRFMFSSGTVASGTFALYGLTTDQV